MILCLLVSFCLPICAQKDNSYTLTEYYLRLDSRFSSFLDGKMKEWGMPNVNENPIDTIAYGILDIIEVNSAYVRFAFSYYRAPYIFEQASIRNAWGIFYIDSVPIILTGYIDDRFCKPTKNVVRLTTRWLDTRLDPCYMIIKVGLKECIKNEL